MRRNRQVARVQACLVAAALIGALGLAACSTEPPEPLEGAADCSAPLVRLQTGSDSSGVIDRRWWGSRGSANLACVMVRSGVPA